MSKETVNLKGRTYNLNFLGLTQSITSFSFDGGTATLDEAVSANVYVRRNPRTDDRQLAWYFGTFDATIPLPF
jgi:hypothetical protein